MSITTAGGFDFVGLRTRLQIGFLVFLLTVNAAVDTLFAVGEAEAMRQFLLDACDTAGVLTPQNVCDLLGKTNPALLDDDIILNDVQRDIRVEHRQGVKIRKN